MFSLLWNYKVQLAPILLSLVILDAINLYRKWTRFYYAPVYFALYPLSEINKGLATYYGDRFDIKEDVSDEDVPKLKHSIRRQAIVSGIIGGILTPALSGFICAFFLPRSELAPFAFLFYGIKTYATFVTLVDFRKYGISTWKGVLSAASVYLCYMLLTLEVFKCSFVWANQYTQAGQYGQLLSELLSLVFVKILAGTLILGGLTTYLSEVILDNAIRQRKKES